jgi:glycosyltransferase involved in cell wall biosynthesis
MSEALRILLVSHFFAPSGETGGNRATALARHLRAAGHEVTVLTSAAYGSLPEDEADGNLRTWDLQLVRARLRGRSEATDAFSSDTFSTRVHPLSRILVPDAHLLAWTPIAAWRALRLRRNGSFDCVFTTSPPESVHLVGSSLASRGLPWIADLRDGWAFEPWIKEQMWPTRAQHRLNERLERRTLTRADAVTAVTGKVTAYLRRELGIEAEVLPNGWEPDAASEAAPSCLDPERVSVIYTGRIAGGRKDPKPLIEALRTLAAGSPEAAERLELVFAGSFTAEEQRLFETDCSPARIVNLGLLDRAGVAALQRAADAAILLTSRERSQESGSKLFEYIGARLPILALARPDSEAAEIVGSLGGVVAGTHDERAIAEGLRRLALGDVPAPGQEAANSYAWPAIAERLVEVMREAIRRRAAAAQGISASTRL